MVNAHIGDGAILIVDRSIEPSHNKIVIASVDGSYACKRLILKPSICLVSEKHGMRRKRPQRGRPTRTCAKLVGNISSWYHRLGAPGYLVCSIFCVCATWVHS